MRQQGMYFPKKYYKDEPLLQFETVRQRLPEPIIEGRPDWIACYWYAIKVLFSHTKKPPKESGFVSNFVDAAFNQNIFLWDTCFMTVFCNLLDSYIPGICSLDNFYAKQHEDGEICREIIQESGEDFPYWVNQYHGPLYSYFHNHYGYRSLFKVAKPPYEELYKPNLGRVVQYHPYLTLDALNHPLLAFAEWQHYLHTKDRERLFITHEALYRYYEALVYHIKHANGLYVTDWASMDNSPRNKELFLGVDISSEMVLFAKYLLMIFATLRESGYEVREYESRRERLLREQEETTAQIRDSMWDEKTGFFYDLDTDLRHINIKTAAAFWTLISKVATEKQQKNLVWYLEDPKTFNRLHRVPVLAADEKEYDPKGGYWRGSVWAPINTMIVLGLEECGYHKQAQEIAKNDIDITAKVYQLTHTIWENYPPDEISNGTSDHPDFVGWSGIAPIYFTIAYAVGLKTYAKKDVLVWDLDHELLKMGNLGCKNYAFWGKEADFKAQLDHGRLILTINTSDHFPLEVRYTTHTFEYTIEGSTRILEEIPQ